MSVRIIGVGGSRPLDYPDPNGRLAFRRLLDYGYAWVDSLPVDGIVIVHGDAPGIDRELGLRAKARGIWVQPFPAPWDLFSRKGYKALAGYTRNDVRIRMVEEEYVFWDGSSRGTRDTIDRAIEYRKLEGVWLPEGQVTPAPGETWEDAIVRTSQGATR